MQKVKVKRRKTFFMVNEKQLTKCKHFTIETSLLLQSLNKSADCFTPFAMTTHGRESAMTTPGGIVSNDYINSNFGEGPGGEVKILLH